MNIKYDWEAINNDHCLNLYIYLVSVIRQMIYMKIYAYHSSETCLKESSGSNYSCEITRYLEDVFIKLIDYHIYDFQCQYVYIYPT